MGISIDKISGSFVGNVNKKMQDERIELADQRHRQFDEIFISSNKLAEEEKKIEGGLTKRLSYELKQPTNQAKIDELKSLVEKGAYEIDVNKLASNILALGE